MITNNNSYFTAVQFDQIILQSAQGGMSPWRYLIPHTIQVVSHQRASKIEKIHHAYMHT